MATDFHSSVMARDTRQFSRLVVWLERLIPGYAIPNDCANDRGLDNKPVLPTLSFNRGLEKAVVAITDDHSCRAGGPYNHGYADGTVSSNAVVLRSVLGGVGMVRRLPKCA